MSVKNALASLPGVANVEIDADARTATVSVQPDEFKAADAVQALEDAGYPADNAEDISAEP